MKRILYKILRVFTGLTTSSPFNHVHNTALTAENKVSLLVPIPARLFLRISFKVNENLRRLYLNIFNQSKRDLLLENR